MQVRDGLWETGVLSGDQVYASGIVCSMWLEYHMPELLLWVKQTGFDCLCIASSCAIQ